jgi:hypothetical protein
MANELIVNLSPATQSGLTIVAKLFLADALVYSIALPETPAASGRYTNTTNFVSLGAGMYDVQALSGTTLVAVGSLNWSGTAEVISGGLDLSEATGTLPGSAFINLPAFTFAQAAAALNLPTRGLPEQGFFQGDYVTLTIPTLSVADAVKIWFTMKPATSYQNVPDSQATIQIERTAGLLYLVKQTYSGANTDGSITVNSTNDGIVVNVESRVSALVPPGDYVIAIRKQTNSTLNRSSTVATGQLTVFPSVISST